jgi:hypothetical protein
VEWSRCCRDDFREEAAISAEECVLAEVRRLVRCRFSGVWTDDGVGDGRRFRAMRVGGTRQLAIMRSHRLRGPKQLQGSAFPPGSLDNAGRRRSTAATRAMAKPVPGPEPEGWRGRVLVNGSWSGWPGIQNAGYASGRAAGRGEGTAG